MPQSANHDASPSALDTPSALDITEAPVKPLTPAARRALDEAAVRRAAREAIEQQRAQEIGGRPGPDPVRYGDWEQGGIAWDF